MARVVIDPLIGNTGTGFHILIPEIALARHARGLPRSEHTPQVTGGLVIDHRVVARTRENIDPGVEPRPIGSDTGVLVPVVLGQVVDHRVLLPAFNLDAIPAIVESLAVANMIPVPAQNLEAVLPIGVCHTIDEMVVVPSDMKPSALVIFRDDPDDLILVAADINSIINAPLDCAVTNGGPCASDRNTVARHSVTVDGIAVQVEVSAPCQSNGP
jgi:hypothetical protein